MGKKSSSKKFATEEPIAKPSSLPLDHNQQGKPWLKWQCLAIFLMAFVLYANTLGNQYALDDMIVLTKNTFTQQGIAGIDEIMTTDAFHGFFGPNYAFVIGGRYRPISMVTFALEYELFGLKYPWVYHFNNIILYGLTCVLILLTLQRLFSAKFEGQYAWLTIPFIATLLFTAHPIHTEVVANIKGRDEILGMLGAIATLYLAIRYIETDKIGYLVASLPVFILAILSKENAITFLAVIPLAYYFFSRNVKLHKILLVAAPLVLGIGIYFLIRNANLPKINIESKTYEILNDPFAFTGFADRLATVAFTFGKYLQLLIFPHPLTHDYYPWQVPIYTWKDWQANLPLFVWMGILGWTVYGVFKKSPIAFGVLYFIITVSIVSNVLFSVGIAMNERFVFMPSLGFAIAAAVLLVKATNYAKAKNWKYGTILNTKPLLLVLGILLVGYSAKTIARNPAWKNDFTLFGTDVKISPNSAKVNNAWGGELYTASDTAATPERAKQYLAQAEVVLKRAIEIHPIYANAWLLLGNVKYKQNTDLAGAADCYRKAAEFNPGSYDAHFNLAIISRDLNRFEEALTYLGQAKALLSGKTPEDQQRLGNNIEQNRGEVYYRWGKYAGQTQNNLPLAVEKISQAIKINPSAANYYEDLGVAYGFMGDYFNSIKASEEGIKIDPNYPPFYYNIAASYKQLKDEAKSQEYFQKAEQLKNQKMP